MPRFVRGLFLLLLCVSLLFSCAPSPDHGGSISVVDTMSVDGSEMIKLTNLRAGELYMLYTDSGNARGSSGVMRTANPSSIGKNSYVFVVPEGTSELELDPAELGLSGGGEIRICEVDAPEFSYTDAAEGMTVGEGITDPVFVEDDGTAVYEEIYRLDISSVPNPESVILLYTHEASSATVNHYFGFIDENGNKISDSSVEAILDLSSYDYVYVFMHFDVKGSATPATATLYTVSPEIVSNGIEISSPAVYLLEPSSSPMYLFLSKPSGSTISNTGLLRESGARYAADGRRFPDFFPIQETADAIVMNVEAHDEAVLFDYGSGCSLTAELKRADGTIYVERMGKESRTFTIPEGVTLFPIDFDTLSDVEVSYSSDSSDAGTLFLRSGHADEYGYSARSIHSGETAEVEAHHTLESGFIVRHGGNLPAVDVTVTIE